MFTEREQEYLSGHGLGRLATIGPSGAPMNHVVACWVDVHRPGGQHGRGLEIRGTAEVVAVERPPLDGFTADVLRIRPRRILSWNVEGSGDHHRTVR